MITGLHDNIESLALDGEVVAVNPDLEHAPSLVSEEPYTALPIVVYNWARQPQQEFVELTAAAIIVLLVLLWGYLRK